MKITLGTVAAKLRPYILPILFSVLLLSAFFLLEFPFNSIGLLWLLPFGWKFRSRVIASINEANTARSKAASQAKTLKAGAEKATAELDAAKKELAKVAPQVRRVELENSQLKRSNADMLADMDFLHRKLHAMEAKFLELRANDVGSAAHGGSHVNLQRLEELIKEFLSDIVEFGDDFVSFDSERGTLTFVSQRLQRLVKDGAIDESDIPTLSITGVRPVSPAFKVSDAYRNGALTPAKIANGSNNMKFLLTVVAADREGNTLICRKIADQTLPAPGAN